jgi:hypothetical protein
VTVRRACWFAVAAAVLIGIATLFFFRRSASPAAAIVRPGDGATKVSPPLAPPAAGPAHGTSAPEEQPSHLADALNVRDGTIRHDLEILNEVFTAWQTNFPHEGNPVGENAEITAALTGANQLGYAFVPRNHPAVNAQGELCDRWGTPFRFHQVSGSLMEIRSAGPDRKFGTADDAFWPPSNPH